MPHVVYSPEAENDIFRGQTQPPEFSFFFPFFVFSLFRVIRVFRGRNLTAHSLKEQHGLQHIDGTQAERPSC